MRILLVSDMHYTTDLSDEQMKKIKPDANVSAASGDAFGHTQSQKIQRVLSDIYAEHERSALDMVLILGDLSIDDYSCRNLDHNYCRKFKEECMDKLPCPVYAIPGNHDSYPNDMWRELFGYDRQLCVDAGDCIFIMIDNFNDCPAYTAAGSAYTLTDTAWLTGQLDKYSGKNIFILSHMINPAKESAEFREIVKSNPDIIALFRGHTHIDETIQLDESWGNKLLIDIGGYAYNGRCIDGKYIFSEFDEKWAWGYQMIETTCDAIATWHTKPGIYYKASNGNFDFKQFDTEHIVLKGL